MSANPALTDLGGGELAPTPFPGETIVLRRPGTDFSIDGVQTSGGKWQARGTLFLTNVRVVFIADKADPSGLVAFDLPLVYIRKDRFNQPIFGANNLSGQCWPAAPGGGPMGALPPHDFAVHFKNGGAGTFTAFYFQFKEYYATHVQRVQQQAVEPSAPPMPYEMPAQWQSTAFVDPSDPTTLYLSQPVAQRLPEEPRYSPMYGRAEEDRPYEPM